MRHKENARTLLQEIKKKGDQMEEMDGVNKIVAHDSCHDKSSKERINRDYI